MQLQPPPLEPHALDLLRHLLADEHGYQRLLAQFIEQTPEDKLPSNDDSRRIYKNSVIAITQDSARQICALTQSSLERTFIRSLVLNFLTDDGQGLVVHPTLYNAPAEIADFRSTLARLVQIKERFHDGRSTDDFSLFLDQEAAQGRMTWSERRALTPFVAKYYYGTLDAQFHLTMQARFPDVRVGGGGVVADMYFWIPRHPSINIIVECDGYPYHSSEEKFTSDRQRDRAFKAKGYDVLRFSGSEVHDDPILATHQLATYLAQRVNAADSATESGCTELAFTRNQTGGQGAAG